MIAAHEVIREGVPDSEEKGIDRINNDDYFSSIIKTFALYKFHVLKQLKPITAYLNPNNFGKYEKIQSSFQTQENSTTI